MPKRLYARLAPLAILAFAGGCVSDPGAAYFGAVRSHATVYVAPGPCAVERVAVLPFKAPTELIGASVSDIVVTEILKAGRYTLVERSQMGNVLNEAEIALSGLSEKRAAELGRLLGADGVIIGTVDEYATVAERGSTYPVTGVAIRLIECRTGKVLWTAHAARRSETPGVALALHARQVVHDMVAGVYQAWSVQPKVAALSAPAPSAPSTSDAGVPATVSLPAPAPVVALPPPPTLTSFTVSDLGLRQATLTWVPGSGTTRCRVERAASTTGPFAAITTVDAQAGSYVDRGSRSEPLRDGTAYHYRMVPLAADGREGPATPTRESLMALPPDPPADLEVTAPAGRTLRLAWKASRSDGIKTYRVERAPGAGSDPFATVGETPSLTITDTGSDHAPLQDAATYLYRVRSINAVGAVGDPTPAVSAATRPPPETVAGLTARSGGFRSVLLTWQPSSNADVTAYVILRTDGTTAPLDVARVEGRETCAWQDRGTATAAAPVGALKDATSYAYQVVAISAWGARSPTGTAIQATTAGPPAAPEGGVATTNLVRSIGVRWPPVSRAASYRLESAEAEQGPYSALAELPVLAATGAAFSNAVEQANVARWYRLAAVDAHGLVGPWSLPIRGFSRPCPPPPASATFAYAPGELRVTWQAPAALTSLTYRLRRGQRLLYEGAATAAVLTPAEIDTDVELALSSVDDAGQESETRTVVTVEEPPPGVPPAPRASIDGLREIRLSWNAAADNARTWRLQRAGTPQGPFVDIAALPAATLAFTDRDSTARPSLPDDASRCYRLVAVARNGKASDPSPVAQGRTAPPPAPPLAITASTPGARAVALDWTPSPADGVTAYHVERAGVPPAAFKAAGDVEGAHFQEGGTAASPLADCAPYRYRVAAVNRVGSVGPWSPELVVTTRPPPAVVASLTARSGEVRCVPLAWSPSPESDVVKYELDRAESPAGPFSRLVDIDGRLRTSFLDGGKDPGNLPDSRTFVYRLRAVNAVGARSADSPAALATTRPPPPPVTGLRARSGCPREIPLAWSVSSDEKVAGYHVLRLAECTNAVRIAALDGREHTSFVDRGETRRASGLGTLRDAADYTYAVVAFNTGRAISPPSEPAKARTKPAPAVPRGLVASTNLPRSVRLSWRPNSEPDIREYVVEAARDAASSFVEVARVPASPGDAVTCVETRLPDRATRHYRVKAIDRDTLESFWTAPIVAATKTRPEPPTGLTVSWSTPDARLTWTPPPQTDIREYRVWKTGLLGSQIGGTRTPELLIERRVVGKGCALAVTAVDDDGLESDRSVALEVQSPPTVAAP